MKKDREKGREDFEKPKHFKVCSNHFLEGKSTKCNPDPILFLKISTNTMPAPTKPRPPPKKRCVSSSLADNIELPLQFLDSTPIVLNNIFRTFVADDRKQPLSSRKSNEMVFSYVICVKACFSFIKYKKKNATYCNLWPFCNIINCIFSHCFRIRNSEFLHS